MGKPADGRGNTGSTDGIKAGGGRRRERTPHLQSESGYNR